MAYSTAAEVKDTVLATMATQAGWADAQFDERILEADRTIDAKLAAMGYPAPFGTTPPLVNTMSILYARYASVRDLFLKGAPSKANASTEQGYLDRFYELIRELKEGEAKLLDTGGVPIAPTSDAYRVQTTAADVGRALTMGEPETQSMPPGYTNDDVVGIEDNT